MANNYRIRPDGTGTFTSVEHDSEWYYPVGTRVVLVNGDAGIVTKQNSVTANVTGDSGRLYLRVPVRGLTREANNG
jgi:hypothetical protein